MSRLGKKPIQIVEKAEVTVADNTVSVKGPLGELSIKYNPAIEIKVEDGQVVLSPVKETLENKALWGTYSSLITGMIEGVTEGFSKELVIEGVGYKAEMKGNTLVLNVGFSHQVEMPVPDGLKVEVEKEVIKVSGFDKQAVGQFAAEIRATKKPEPYKGKGIRYADEVVRRKEGKKTV
jgi:large subunit ribosomal protein L6